MLSRPLAVRVLSVVGLAPPWVYLGWIRPRHPLWGASVEEARVHLAWDDLGTAPDAGSNVGADHHGETGPSLALDRAEGLSGCGSTSVTLRATSPAQRGCFAG